MTYSNNDPDSSKKTGNSNSINKWGGIAGLCLLTFGLIIFFKQNSGDVSTIEDKLVKFYAQNLQPLFVTTEITNEDIFNFALYQNLPIDKKENKVLEIVNIEGNEVDFQVKNAHINTSTTNYKKFIAHFNLNTIQQYSLDSLLDSYKNNVYSSVLINDKNVVAVDPKILVLRESLVYDISKYLEKNKLSEPGEFSANYSSKVFNDKAIRLFDEVKNKNVTNSTINDSYICFTPDSVYKIKCQFDPVAIKKQINIVNNNGLRKNNKKNNIEVGYDDDNNNNSKLVNFGLVSDSVIYRTGKTDGIVATVVMPVLNTLFSQIKSVEKIKTTGINTHSKVPIIKLRDLPDTPEIQFEANLQNIDSIISASISVVTDENIKSWVQFGLKMDSLSSSFSYVSQTDSLERIQELSKELKQLKKEMEKLKKQKIKIKSSED
ncbi:MAG: hypothetical protein V1773_15825 [bacterium]